MYRIGNEETEAFARVIKSRSLFKINSGAQEVLHCEDEFKQYLGVKYSLLMTSGKAALISALISHGIGPGDEIIIPAYTYIATAIAVTATGAIPVICDVDECLTLDPVAVENKISKHTKAIIPVHIQGFPSNMAKLLEISKKYKILIIEDACQSIGGMYKGKYLGTIGDAGAYSFNYFKLITSGEGGMLITDNRTIFERALIYHDSSAVAYFGTQLDGVKEPTFCGNEYRISEFTGAILREQLKKLNDILADLRKNKTAITEGIRDVLQIVPSHDITGDTGSTLPVRFENAETANAFASAVGGTVPIFTGKHVYCNWTPIMEKRGAFHPLMDPFKMEANQGLQMDYTPDMCPKTLDLLRRTVYISINPDWDEEEILFCIKKCRDSIPI